MTTMFVCLALATIVALVSAGDYKCDEKMITFICGSEAKEHAKKMMDAMTPECKAKAEELKGTMETKHEEMCKKTDDVTATCTTMNTMFKEVKDHMGEECRPKM